MSQKSDYFIIKVKHLELVEAVPYTRVSEGSRKGKSFYKKPTILLRDKQLNRDFAILDTSMFSRFIMSMDNEVSFLDCNHWLSLSIDGEIDFYDLVSSFIQDYPDTSFGVWVTSGVIHGIDDGAWDSKSKYLVELYEQLPAYLMHKPPDWDSYMRMSKIDGKMYPTLVYINGKKTIEIVCATQRTYIVGRYEVGDGFIQPLRTSMLSFWTHLVPLEIFHDEVEKHLDAMDNINVKELPEQPFTKARANSIDFADRNRLEYENYLLIFQ